MAQHYVLCGLGRVGLSILSHLRAMGAQVVVIDLNHHDPEKVGDVKVIRGDCTKRHVLEEADVAHAAGILVVTSDELVNLSCTLMARHLNPTVRIIVRMYNQNLILQLGTAVKNVAALSVSGLAGPLLGLIACTGEALGTIRFDHSASLQISTVHVESQSSLSGKTIREISREFAVTVLGQSESDGEFTILQQVDDLRKVTPGMQLVVCGEVPRIAQLASYGENESLPQLLWGNFVLRWLRAGWKTLASIEQPVIWCLVVLLSVIFLSVLIFHFGSEKHTVVMAIYRTVSLMATGADMHGEEFPENSWLRVYISILRLVGMVLTAAFTAIFTNYLIRSNLRGTFEIRRVPESGHVVICGLGNIGFRVAEELLSRGEQVVVLEPRQENAFVAAARRMGAAVVIGDGTMVQVLKQARVADSKAVVAATSNELVNVEIALQVRSLAPEKRVVVRLLDSSLAQMLRHAANIQFALAIPELAAPAFVARLFGDRVRSLFLFRERLLLAVDVIVRPDDAYLLTPTIAEIERTLRCRAVRIRDEKFTPREFGPDHHLQPGDSLTVIVAQEDLQPLLHRE